MHSIHVKWLSFPYLIICGINAFANVEDTAIHLERAVPIPDSLVQNTDQTPNTKAVRK